MKLRTWQERLALRAFDRALEIAAVTDRELPPGTVIRRLGVVTRGDLEHLTSDLVRQERADWLMPR